MGLWTFPFGIECRLRIEGGNDVLNRNLLIKSLIRGRIGIGTEAFRECVGVMVWLGDVRDLVLNIKYKSYWSCLWQRLSLLQTVPGR